MRKGKAKRTMKDVLSYRPSGVSRSTVRRYYIRWRGERGLPPRCDNPGCQFYTSPLIWNGKILLLILDHIDGNNKDNRPEMLRFLCPNCDSQLCTRGGANVGRVERSSEQGFVLLSRDGHREYTYFPSGGITPSGSALTSFHPAASSAQPDIAADSAKVALLLRR